MKSSPFSLYVYLMILYHNMRALAIQLFSINDFSYGYMGKRSFLVLSGIAFAIVGLLFTFTQLPEYRFIAPNPLDFFIVASSQLVGLVLFYQSSLK